MKKRESDSSPHQPGPRATGVLIRHSHSGLGGGRDRLGLLESLPEVNGVYVNTLTRVYKFDFVASHVPFYFGSILAAPERDDRSVDCVGFTEKTENAVNATASADFPGCSFLPVKHFLRSKAPNLLS
jgi:hypothetical protein